MPDYNKCVIYTIRSGEGLYVGSSCNFVKRKHKHNSDLNNKNSKNHNLKLYRVIRENDGNWDMQPHSQYPCNSKMEMAIEEERIRKELKADLNMISCFQSKDERLENQKDYYINNKDEIAVTQKNYRINNKYEIADKQKNYYKNNKEKLIDKRKNYIIKNKEKLTEKFSCACGGKYQYQTKSTHFKTARHIKYIRDKELNIIQNNLNITNKL